MDQLRQQLPHIVWVLDVSETIVSQAIQIARVTLSFIRNISAIAMADVRGLPDAAL